MSDHDLITLPRPVLYRPIAGVEQDFKRRKARLREITTQIEDLETLYRNLRSLLGVGEPSMPQDPDLPEQTNLRRWSNFSGELFAAYRTGAKSRELEAAQMYSTYVDVPKEVADIVALAPRARGELKLAVARVSVHIQQLLFPEAVEHEEPADGLLEFLKRHLNDAHEMLATVMEQVDEAAAAIDWVETVGERPSRHHGAGAF